MAVAVVVVAVMRVRLAQTLNANWDELFFLSKVHAYARGDLASKLLTFHVHFFSWITSLDVRSTNEIAQVVILRDVMLVLGAVAAVATFFIGFRLHGSVVGALFAVFLGQSFSFMLQHGASARYD